jgi:hypothetical protein
VPDAVVRHTKIRYVLCKKMIHRFNSSRSYLNLKLITLWGRVDRWHFLKPKIIIWVNLGRCWYILRPFGIFFGHFGIIYGHLIYLWLLGLFSPFWYVVPRKIWQPCCGGQYLSLRKIHVRKNGHKRLFISFAAWEKLNTFSQ